MKSNPRRAGRRGITLVLATLLLNAIVMPMVALAIDLTILDMTRARLGAALDAAALAVGRSLKGSETLTAQNARLRAVATQVMHANLPPKFWGSEKGSVIGDGTEDFNVYQPETPANGAPAPEAVSRILIKIKARVNIPLLFARFLNQDNATVSMNTVAARRFVRIVLVLDHSGSMDKNIVELRKAVLGKNLDGKGGFLSYFIDNAAAATSGTDSDKLGLVAYAGSAIVAYPPRNPLNPDSGNGPDGDFRASMTTLVKDMYATGYTGAAEALSLAHRELRKNKNAYTLYFKAIVFMTDGRPNQFIVPFNGVPSKLSVKLYDTDDLAVAASASVPTWAGNQTCSIVNPVSPYPHNTTSPYYYTSVLGRIGTSDDVGSRTDCDPNGSWAGSGTCPEGGRISRQYVPYSKYNKDYPFTGYTPSDTTNFSDVDNWLKATSSTNEDSYTRIRSTNCGFTKGVKFATNDLRRNDSTHGSIPEADAYGNSTTCDAKEIQSSWHYLNLKGGAQDRTKWMDPYQYELASWCTTLNAAKRIRRDPDLKPVILSLGFNTAGSSIKMDSGLLKRIANSSDPNDFTTNPDKVHGTYLTGDVETGAGITRGRYYYADAGGLDDAFRRIAQELLRLTQ